MFQNKIEHDIKRIEDKIDKNHKELIDILKDIKSTTTVIDVRTNLYFDSISAELEKIKKRIKK